MNQKDIAKLIEEFFLKNFPEISRAEADDLVQDIGETITVEALVALVEKITEKDSEKGKGVNKIILEDTKNSAIGEISKICEDLGIDVLQIYKDVAKDVIEDVMRVD